MKKSRGRNTVIRGSLKYKPLPVPVAIKGKSFTTSQKVKESAFQLFENHLPDYSQVIFWDLFAGSGQMGIEAISRGVRFCTFCDISKERLNQVRDFLSAFDFGNRVSFYRADALRALQACLLKIPPQLQADPLQFDLAIYADPPFDFSLNHIYNRIVARFNQLSEKLVYRSCVLIIQLPEKTKLAGGLNVKVYDYGKNQLAVLNLD